MKARDDAGEALKTVKKEKSKLESSLELYAKENEKLKSQNKTIVANNIKSLQEVKSERDSMKDKLEDLESELAAARKKVLTMIKFYSVSTSIFTEKNSQHSHNTFTVF